MGRGILLGLGIGIGVAAAWLAGLAFGPASEPASLAIEDTRVHAMRRLANENAELRRLQADRPAPLEGERDRVPRPAPPDAAATPEPPHSSQPPGHLPVERRWRASRSVPPDIPEALRGTPGMWIEALRRADEAGNTEHAHFHVMALIAVGPAAVEPLLDLLRDDDERPSLRLRALAALRTLAPGRLATLASGLIEQEPAGSLLRQEALQLLARSRPARVSRTVVDIAYDPEAPLAERQHAMSAVLHADPREADTLIRRTLRDGTDAEKATAYRVLAEARQPALRSLIQDVVAEAPADRQRDLLQALARMKGPGWGDAQMTGAPDTPVAGDNQTAWAHEKPQEGLVWVELDFPVEVMPEQIRVHETFNAGAIVKCEGRTAGGDYVTLWAGEAGAARTPRWFAPPLAPLDGRIRTVRLTLDTDRVSGWNEIDAVELVGDGRRQWASAARSSSCYARRKE